MSQPRSWCGSCLNGREYVFRRILQSTLFVRRQPPFESRFMDEPRDKTRPQTGRKPARRSSKAWSYTSSTRTVTYGFLASLPLFVLYEVGIVLANRGAIAGIEVGAGVWLKTLLVVLGGRGWFAMGLVVLGIGLWAFWHDRHRRPPIRRDYFIRLVAESSLYAVLLAVSIGYAVGVWFGIWALPMGVVQTVSGLSVPLKLILSIGAGLYEELVFRVLLVGGMFWVMARLMEHRKAAYALAAVVGALIFAAAHYVGPLGDPFEIPSFTFRALFGLALNGVFLLRGFAVAAWTHALYDVFVTFLNA